MENLDGEQQSTPHLTHHVPEVGHDQNYCQHGEDDTNDQEGKSNPLVYRMSIVKHDLV